MICWRMTIFKKEIELVKNKTKTKKNERGREGTIPETT